MSSALIRSTKYLSDGFTVGGVTVHTNRIMHEGETVTAHFKGDEPTVKAQDILLPVLYCGSECVAFDKPAGLVVHPTLGYPDGTAANAFAAWCLKNGQEFTFRPVYRIDKNTSGCLLVAKSRYSASLLNANVQKEYICFVEGRMPKACGSIDAPIGLEDGSFIKRCIRADGQESYTEYRVTGEYAGYSRLSVHIRTGRTHQIRVHMAGVGHPLLGDTLYGGGDSLISRQALHCAKIVFYDGEKEVTAVSPLPMDMAVLEN